MNIIIFGLLFLVLGLYGSEESCQESRQLESTCGTYCHKVLKTVLDHTKALERQLTDFKPEEKCLSENKFDSQEKKTELKFKDLDVAIESILQQIKLQGKQFEQQLDHLHKAEEVKKQIPGPPYQQIGSKYYYIEESEKVNWFSAVNKCLILGGHLVSIQNLDEFNAIKQKLQDYKYYWIDINDLANKDEYTSISTGGRANFFMWDSGQPYNIDGNYNCCALDSYRELKMVLSTCTYKMLFICEFRN